MEDKEEIVKYHLQELAKRGFVREINLPGIGPPGQSSWFITDKGKKYLIENKPIS
jgi:repressor of nif and glnA expression